MLHMCGSIAAAVLIDFVLVLLPGNTEIYTFPARESGLLISYKPKEVHPHIPGVIGVLILLTAWNAGLSKRGGLLLTAGFAIFITALVVFGLPVTLAWVAAVIILCLARQRYFFFSSRGRHTRYIGDWSSDVCSSDLVRPRHHRIGRTPAPARGRTRPRSVP